MLDILSPIVPAELAPFLSAEAGWEAMYSQLDGDEPAASFGRDPDLGKHLTMLRAEFSGKPVALFYHAGITVLIRREMDLTVNVIRFRTLWRRMSAELCAGLDSRWLVSACDTFMDHGENDAERALAAAGALFANTIKLYETERWSRGAEGPLRVPVGIVPLHDGMTAFLIGRGDMVANLHRRVLAVTSADRPAARILRELLARASRHDTVFRRFGEVHTDPETAWLTLAGG